MSLPEPVLQLLQAVVDAVDLPLATLTERDDRERGLLLDRRATQVAIILGTILKHADTTTIDELAKDAERLRGYASGPLTYTPWKAPQNGSAS